MAERGVEEVEVKVEAVQGFNDTLIMHDPQFRRQNRPHVNH